MKFQNPTKIFYYLVLCLGLTFSMPVGAEESAEDKELTQGQVAKLLLLRFGLWDQDGVIPTQESATSRLSALSIEPLGGWDAGSIMTTNEIARVLGQALGLDADFSEDEKTDPSATAYKDALIAQFDVDIDQLGRTLASRTTSVPLAPENQAPGMGSDTDPIEKPVIPDTDDLVMFSSDLVVVLEEVTVAAPPAQDITPAAP